ncbi:MAG: hypothetical protein HC840_32385 [Leptolyngbyaceae cyanobacterium RM2_2_4]|nr:hypothetical protein [Leptolyngbyaceae cyanobacterium RM2_2_4]
MPRKNRKKQKTSTQENVRAKSKGFAARRPKAEFTGFTYHQMQLPFDSMTEDQVVELIKKLGAEFNQQFTTSFEALQKQILTVDPCSLLSFFSYYDLTTSPGVSREWTEENPILQHHVEFYKVYFFNNHKTHLVANLPYHKILLSFVN